MIKGYKKICFAFGNQQQIQYIRKFYKLATVEKNVNVNGTDNPEEQFSQWLIKLDQKQIRTPQRQIVAVPSLPLAQFIAHEFNMQKDFMRPPTMPLLSMARTAIDMQFNEQLKNQHAQSTFGFFENDTILFREDKGKKLNKIQTEKLDPIVDLFEKTFNVKLPINYGFEVQSLRTEDKEQMQAYFFGMNSWELISIQIATQNLKSFCLSLLLHKSLISIRQAVQLSRLEEQFSIDTFGLVEGSHDVDENITMVNTSAAKLFQQLVNYK